MRYSRIIAAVVDSQRVDELLQNIPDLLTGCWTSVHLAPSQCLVDLEQVRGRRFEAGVFSGETLRGVLYYSLCGASAGCLYNVQSTPSYACKHQVEV